MPKKIKPEDFIRIAFERTPEEAIRYLRDQGYVITRSANELEGEAYNTYFTVAGILKLDILMSLKESLIKALQDGVPINQWRKEIKEQLKEFSTGQIDDTRTPVITGTALTDHRLNTIFRTNVQSALNAERYIAQLQLQDRRPYGIIIVTLDSRTSNICKSIAQSLGNRALPISEMGPMIPPNHHDCRSYITTLSPAQVQRRGMEIVNALSDLKVPSDPKNPDSALVSWKAAEGFHKSPIDPWKPDLTKYPKSFAKKFSDALASIQ